MATSTVPKSLIRPEINGWLPAFITPNLGLCVIIPCDTTKISLTPRFSQVNINGTWTNLASDWAFVAYGSFYLAYYQGTEISGLSGIQLVNLDFRVSAI